MEIKIRNFTQEYNELKRQINLTETIEDMAYSYVQIGSNNPLLAIAKYINVVFKPIVNLKFTNTGENAWRGVYNSYNSNFMYNDVSIQNLVMCSMDPCRKDDVKRLNIRDISTGKAQTVLCVDVWENGYRIIEKTNSPELISHLCHDWKEIKERIDFTLEDIISQKLKEASKESESNLYYVEKIRNFEI